MNILHISDLHFGPRHWEGNDRALLDKINSYSADMVINTGDSTTDGLESEFKEAERFLKGITCENVISIIGNHDKRSLRSHELFRKHIYDTEIISPLIPERTTKGNLYLDRKIAKVKENFTDYNFIKTVCLNGETVLIINIDSNELYQDDGFVEEQILMAISKEIKGIRYDKSMLLIHHSIFSTDEDPLKNSLQVIDFIQENKIEHVLCGHTHELDLRKSTNLYIRHTFTQYMCGATSCCNHSRADNMFLFYENWSTDRMQTHVVSIFPEGDKLRFKKETVC